MAKPINESDCLELVSIGTLYSGPWAKKYWSSSRGRDRYPYPIGYHALRIHSGVTYKMEINEGTQGPTFQVTSSDGHVGSGRTPDLACEDFQKKNSSHIKMWHAKRFSCKVDGVEFFGFRNALVQRLLRELMAHVNGSSGQSLPSTSFSDEHVTEEHDSPSPQRCKYPDVLQNSSKSKSARKRNRHEFSNVKAASLSEAFQPYQASSTKLLFTEGRNQSEEEMPVLASVCTEDGGKGCDVAVSGCFEPCIEVPVSDNKLHSNSDKCCAYSDGRAYFTQQKQPFSVAASHFASAPVYPEPPVKSNSLDKSESPRVQQPNPSISIEQGFEESLIVNDSEGSIDSQVDKNSHLFASDTLDTQQENIISHDSPSIREKTETREDTAAADSLLSKGPVRWAPQEQQVVMSGSFDSLGDDSVGEEIAKSMMTILLPKAVPLLTYQSRRKKKKLNALTGVLIKPKSDDEMLHEISKLNRPDEEPKQDYPVRQSGSMKVYAGHISSESILCQFNSAHEMLQFHDAAKVVKPNPEKIMFRPDVGEMHVSVHASKDLTFSYGHTYTWRQTERNIQTPFHNSSASPLEPSLSPENIKDGFQETDLVSVPLAESNAIKPEAHSGTNKLILDGSGSLSDSVLFSLLLRCDKNYGGWKISELPEKKLFSREIVNLPVNSSIPRSSTASFRTNYIGPLSESISCRNMEEESLVAAGPEDNLPGVPDSEIASTSFASYHGKATRDILDGNEHKNIVDGKFECPIKRIGCYSHPMQISSVLTSRIANDIYLCVSCHLSEENRRKLFVYKLPVRSPSLGSPSFLGHIALTLPVLKDSLGKEISVERTGLQFTPDARGLILLNSIEFLCCRKGRHSCSCSTCLPHCLHESGVKIVQVGHGHASLLVKLKTANPVHVLLVCEPNHLVALDASGVLHLWVMNPTWSAPAEDYVISSYDHVASRVVDLKKVPQCDSLVVGHNGCGDFSLWDIIKRSVISRFSAPASSILDFLPISLFNWNTKRDGSICKATVTEATRKGLLDYRKKTALPSIGANVAVWILVHTASDSSGEPGFQSSSCQKSSIWKLGLLVKDRVLLGTTIPRSCAVNVFSGHAIMGTNEGLVYVWELLGGTMVKIIDEFEGTNISHIATDGSVVAIAGEDAKLRVYLLC